MPTLTFFGVVKVDRGVEVGEGISRISPVVIDTTPFFIVTDGEAK
jgi:hypothetical protein